MAFELHTRRAVLKSGVVLALLPGLSACTMREKTGVATAAPVPPSAATATSEATPFVDVHCHCFNASDIPIAGFAEVAILRESAARSADAWSRFLLQVGLAAIKPQVGTLLRFVDALAKAACVSGADELTGTSNPYVGTFGRSVEGDIKRLTLLLTWLRQAGEPESVPAGVDAPSDELFAWALGVVQQSGGVEKLFSILSGAHESHEEASGTAAAKGGSTVTDALLAYAALPNGSEERKQTIRRRAAEVAALVYQPKSDGDWAARYVRLGITGLHARGDLVDDLDALYQRQHVDGARGRLRIYTPAMIDHDFWVQDAGDAKLDCAYDYSRRAQTVPCSAVSTTPLRRQIEVWGKISADKARAHDSDVVAHGFVAFDPLRYAVESARRVAGNYELPSSPPAGSALDLVMSAVTRHGCVGVKVYPPMGFLPAENDLQGVLTSAAYIRTYGREWGDIANKAFASIGIVADDALHQDEEWARRQKATLLNQALDALYRFCSANHVPIMTHASRTQGSFYANVRWTAAALGASPKAWLPVLNKYPNLRLNFGHAGGIWCLGARTAKDADDTFGDDEMRLEPLCALGGQGALDGGKLPAQFGVAGWPLWIFQMMSLKSAGGDARFPHLYADVSDWDQLAETVAGDPEGGLRPHAERAAKTFAFVLGRSNLDRRFDPALIARRMMFGSDWLVMGKSSAAPRYLAAMMHGLDKGGVWSGTPLTQAAFLGGNALNFLGLTKSAHDEIMREAASEAATPYGRLKAFYAGLGPDATPKWARLKAALGHS
ncbi:MAG: hypothetical protein ABL996_07525 [Micropepsaceae bacterium]